MPYSAGHWTPASGGVNHIYIYIYTIKLINISVNYKVQYGQWGCYIRL